MIVPQHIWSKISDPAKYTNPDPVGTGRSRRSLALRRKTTLSVRTRTIGNLANRTSPASATRLMRATPKRKRQWRRANDDWADLYFPNVQKSFVAKDPTHFYYYFAQTGGTIPLVMNTKMAPFNSVVVRKAISMAINREAQRRLGLRLLHRHRQLDGPDRRPRTGLTRRSPRPTTGPRRTWRRLTRCSLPLAIKWARTVSC